MLEYLHYPRFYGVHRNVMKYPYIMLVTEFRNEWPCSILFCPFQVSQFIFIHHMQIFLFIISVIVWLIPNCIKKITYLSLQWLKIVKIILPVEVGNVFMLQHDIVTVSTTPLIKFESSLSRHTVSSMYSWSIIFWPIGSVNASIRRSKLWKKKTIHTLSIHTLSFIL